MSSTIWSKFFWSDWANDEALKLCSFSAQGLWMRMLCIAAGGVPTGYVSVGRNALDESGIARLTGASISEVTDLLRELEQNGVFSRDRQGRIYSRRMVRDAKKRATAQKNGKMGGNPSLGKDSDNSASDNPPLKPEVNTQEPRATIPEVIEPRAQHSTQPREPSLLDALFKAAGIDSFREERHPKLLQIGPMRALIDQGYDLDRDILPVIRERARNVTFNSWAYFVGAIIDAAKLKTSIPPKPDAPTEDWPKRLAVWQQSRTWAQAWGPKPGETGCKVPPELMKAA